MHTHHAMKSRGRWLFAVLAILSISVVVMARQGARKIDDSALQNAGKTGEDWITYGTNWQEQRYSPLKLINDTNIKKLGVGMSLDIPAAPGNPQTRQEATPLVTNGILYSITPWSVVYAVDVRTGKELWHVDPQVNQAVWASRICCGVVNRGIALYDGKVIAPVVDGRMRALDMKDGKMIWETRVSPENQPYTVTMAPRVIKGGKIIIGLAGGEYAVRGYFLALDAKTGKEAWRFYTVPGDPSKPFENDFMKKAAATWDPKNEWYKYGGGGGIWSGIAYDPDTDTVYVSTGQPGPWSEVARGPGDNLCTNCIIAVGGKDGKYKWHYQEVPGDDWDLDSIADMMLVDIKIKGTTRKVLMHAPKDGFFYVLDRVTGELLSADPWVTVSWSSGVDMKTGRPKINPEAKYGTTTTVQVMPGPAGGHTWPAMSYNPATGLVYIPSTSGQSYGFVATEGFVMTPTDLGPTGLGVYNMGTGAARGGGAARGAAPAAAPAAAALAPGLDANNTVALNGAGNRGGAAPALPATPAAPAAGARGPAGPVLPTIGPPVEGRGGQYLIAWDPIAQKEKWRGANGSSSGFNAGGTLSTGGNLVFSVGITNNASHLLAYKADTGELLTDMPLGLSQAGPPTTFMVDGKQYIVVAGGPPGAGGRGGAGGARGGAPATPSAPSKLLFLVLDGKPLQ